MLHGGYGARRGAGVLIVCVLLCALSGCGGNAMERGRAALERGEYETAIRYFDDALSKDSTLSEAYAARGDANLALAEGAVRSQRDARQKAAAEDYAAAVARNRNDAATKEKLLNLYLAIGDGAAEAAETSPNPTELLSDAIDAYEAALALNRANAAVYSRLAEVYLSRGQTEQAAAVLEKGVNSSHDAALSARLSEVRDTLNRKEEEARLAVAAQALQGAPYFGDTGNCAMTPEQARAYAKLLADGLTGKFTGFSGYGRPLFDGNVFWDEPYAVLGYGAYETDRSLCLLADFAGDGVPYLYLFSSTVERNSFEIYGWRDGQVTLAAGIESWGGQQEGMLTGSSRGTMLLEVTESTGERTWTGQSFRFSDGRTVSSSVWDAAWDPTVGAMRVTINGVPERMSETAFSRWNSTTPSTEFNRAESGACDLRTMIGWLNRYAEAMGGSGADAVEVPPQHSDRHQMATAMLRKLFALDQQSVSETAARLSFTRLMDLDGDGQEDLIAAFQGTYETQNDINCQFALYRWRNGELLEVPGGTGFQELHLVRYGTEYGVLGAGRVPENVLTVSDGQAAVRSGQTVATVYAYTLLSHAEAVRVEERQDGTRYYVIKGGVPVAIAESEFNSIRAKYEEIDPIVNYRTSPQNLTYHSTVAALYQMRAREP